MLTFGRALTPRVCTSQGVRNSLYLQWDKRLSLKIRIYRAWQSVSSRTHESERRRCSAAIPAAKAQGVNTRQCPIKARRQPCHTPAAPFGPLPSDGDGVGSEWPPPNFRPPAGHLSGQRACRRSEMAAAGTADAERRVNSSPFHQPTPPESVFRLRRTAQVRAQQRRPPHCTDSRSRRHSTGERPPCWLSVVVVESRSAGLITSQWRAGGDGVPAV